MNSKCKACEDLFEWDDIVIVVDDDIYHKDCLELYPTGFFAMLDGEPLGETENEDGDMACEYIDELLESEK